jgi:peroxiredoxin
VGGFPVGSPAPNLRLPDLNGKTVNLSDFRGTDTLVLFWNNGCGFCQQMLPELKEWEKNRPKGAPKLLLVSGGSPEENRALGLKSPIVLDDRFEAGTAFGAGGTPMAVLVDANGTVASSLAAGKDQVLALAAGTGDGAKPLSV